jgi:hypothetical protein
LGTTLVTRSGRRASFIYGVIDSLPILPPFVLFRCLAGKIQLPTPLGVGRGRVVGFAACSHRLFLSAVGSSSSFPSPPLPCAKMCKPLRVVRASQRAAGSSPTPSSCSRRLSEFDFLCKTNFGSESPFEPKLPLKTEFWCNASTSRLINIDADPGRGYPATPAI